MSKVVNGFKGTAEIRLAMKSGEVDSVVTGWESLRGDQHEGVRNRRVADSLTMG